MKHVVHAAHGTLGDLLFRKVAFDELHLWQMRKVPALAGNQAVAHADRVAAPN